MRTLLLHLKLLYRKSGLFLFIVRLPSRLLKQVMVLLNSKFWTVLLGKAGKNVKIGLSTKFEIPKNVFIGDNVTIGPNVLFSSENQKGILIIHNGVQINRDCEIDYSGNLTIEENVLISAKTTILSHSHGYNPRSVSKGIEKVIRKNVWVGYGVTICENCKEVSENCILATRSVVTKSCLSMSAIYAGVPAVVIRNMTIDEQ